MASPSCNRTAAGIGLSEVITTCVRIGRKRACRVTTSTIVGAPIYACRNHEPDEASSPELEAIGSTTFNRSAFVIVDCWQIRVIVDVSGAKNCAVHVALGITTIPVQWAIKIAKT